jgi:hypothetical protein
MDVRVSDDQEVSTTFVMQCIAPVTVDSFIVSVHSWDISLKFCY